MPRGKTAMITHRCSGHCCDRFYLSDGPDYWERLFARWAVTGISNDRYHDDNVTTAAMIEYLDSSRFDVDGTPIGFEHPVNWYRCKHHQPNGDCGIYNRRPRMCSRYPYGAKCRYPGCTWKDAQLATHPAFDMRVVKNRLLAKWYSAPRA